MGETLKETLERLKERVPLQPAESKQKAEKVIEVGNGAQPADTPQEPKKRKDRGKGFFKIEQRMFADVCALAGNYPKLGIAVPTAYLTLAQGVRSPSTKTKWSVNAIEQHCAVPRGKAKAAVEALKGAGFIVELESGKYPLYNVTPWDEYQALTGKFIGEEPKLIWLPNALVTGLKGEPSPLQRVKYTQDVMTLRLFIELYSMHDLTNEGGIPRDLIWREYQGARLRDIGSNAVWGFQPKTLRAAFNREPFIAQLPYNDPKYRPKSVQAAQEFEQQCKSQLWDRIERLEAAGLLQFIPYLYEGDSPAADPIYAAAYSSTETNDMEERIGTAAQKAAKDMLAREGEGTSRYLIQLPVPKQITQPKVIGIGRLRYKPRTKKTALWFMNLQKEGPKWIRKFDQLSRGTGRGATPPEELEAEVVEGKKDGTWNV